MTKGKRYPQDFKIEVVRRLEKGEKGEDLAKELGVHPVTLSDWKREFGVANHKAKRKTSTKIVRRKNPTQDKIKQLEKDVEFWRNEYLKAYRELASKP